MTEPADFSAQHEVVVVPVDEERGLALVLGGEVGDAESWQMPRGLVADAIHVGGLLGGATAANALLDGSLVRLAPQTVARLKEGAVFLADKQDLALGSLTEAGKGITDAVRFLPGAANPVAASLLLQTMAIQLQLKQMRQTLEEIDEKLDTLLKADRFEVLAEVLATAQGVKELNDKVWRGHALTDADEIKLRDYGDQAHEGGFTKPELWLQQLNALLQLEDPSLKAQFEALDGALRREPVAFWLRVYIVDHMTHAEISKLRLLRAAAVEPDYARELSDGLQEQLRASASATQSLCLDIDRYLRRSDIADGLEELSFLRKAKVRKLRRQLWDVDERLKVTLEATRGMYEAVPSLEPIEVPSPLDRRAVEPWVVRDSLLDAAVKAADVGSDALTSAADRGASALREFADKRRADNLDQEGVAEPDTPVLEDRE